MTDLDLEGLSDVDFESIFQPTFVKLKELGYTIPDSWDVDGFLVDIPDQKLTKSPPKWANHQQSTYCNPVVSSIRSPVYNFKYTRLKIKS